MATVEQHMGHAGRDSRSGPGAGRRHGRDNLAEVISIRTEHVRSHRPGFLGSLVTMARGFAASRAQATSVRSTPHRPPSPAPLSIAHPLPLPLPLRPTPNDAA
ncbi:MAG TPA: hypothetical protein VMP41_11200 [Acidimicrobiales bacterium]|nr:hypothetical protein [Acidimicrobiales bacterium]